MVPFGCRIRVVTPGAMVGAVVGVEVGRVTDVGVGETAITVGVKAMDVGVGETTMDVEVGAILVGVVTG